MICANFTMCQPVSSSSTLGKVTLTNLNNLSEYCADQYKDQALKVDDVDGVKEYSLMDIAKEVNVNIFKAENPDQATEMIVREAIKCLPQGSAPGLSTEVRNQLYVNGIKPNLLKRWYITRKNFSDVTICSGKHNSVIVPIEVHSPNSDNNNAYSPTIRKAVLMMSDMMRLVKFIFEPSELKMACLCFPTLRHKTCVIEVLIHFDPSTCTFFYAIKHVPCFDIMCKIASAIELNLKVFQGIPNTSMKAVDRFPIYLTKTEMEGFVGKSAIQLPSHSTLICDGTYCYKKPLYKSEVSILVQIFLQQAKLKYPPKHMVLYTCLSQTTFLMYPKVLHDPLTAEEAEPCLKELVIKVHVALKELHDLGYQHGDARFPNICYNSTFEPVLIDLDRASPVVHGCSFDEDIQCFSKEILHHFENKHEKAVQSDEFLGEMVRKGIFNEKLLGDSFIAKFDVAIKSVLTHKIQSIANSGTSSL